MKWIGSLRSRLAFAIAVAVIVSISGVTLFIVRYYLPVRDVTPILRLLESGTRKDLESADLLIRGLCWEIYKDGTRGYAKDEHRISLRGAGAEKVKKAMLKVMAASGDPDSLLSMFACFVGSDGEGEVVFRGQDEWEIIRKATDRYNARQPERAPTFFVSKTKDGVYYLNGSGQRVP